MTLTEKKFAYTFFRVHQRVLYARYIHRHEHAQNFSSPVITSFKQISTGVPQGSVLGPLLLLVYINGLCRCVKYSEIYHFNDDTNIVQPHSSLEILT